MGLDNNRIRRVAQVLAFFALINFDIRAQSPLQRFLSTIATTQVKINLKTSKSVFSFDGMRVGDICFKGNNCFQNERFRVELLNNVFEFRNPDGSTMYAPGRIVDSYSFEETDSNPSITYVTGVDNGLLPPTRPLSDARSAARS